MKKILFILLLTFAVLSGQSQCQADSFVNEMRKESAKSNRMAWTALSLEGSGSTVKGDTLEILVGTDVKYIRCRKYLYRIINGQLKRVN